MWRHVLSLTLTLFALVAARPALAAPQVVIGQGTLAGTREDGILVFRGIPYAAPPVGAWRWRPPRAPAKWHGVRRADQFGAICPQPQTAGDKEPIRDFQQSEDCLTINIWTPSRTPPRKLPVMVWIHGGGFRTGASAFPFYDGTDLAKHNVVVVSFNYRLGWLGFLDISAFTDPGAKTANGNFGLMDQIAALKWVRHNISAFGGDPRNVTIFGESAGGMSVNDLMVSPAARGLFVHAIAESGLGLLLMPRADIARKAAQALAKRLKIAQTGKAALAQLQTLPASTFVADEKQIPLDHGATPMVDGTLVPQEPAALFARGRIAKAAYLAGSNSDEASLMQALSLTTRKTLARYGAALPRVRKIYEHALGPLSDAALAHQIFDDALFVSGAHALAHYVAQAGEPAYTYEFAYVPTAQRSKQKGVGHGGEIPFVFGLKGFAKFPALKRALDDHVSASDRKIMNMIETYWTNFARSGNPNGNGLPHWPKLTRNRAATLVIGDDGVHAVNRFHARRLAVVYRTWKDDADVPVPAATTGTRDPAASDGTAGHSLPR